jgi:hypothetical protein
MNSETRVLIVVMIVVGFFACCCLCVPVGLFVFAPVITKVQQEVARAEARRAADERARVQGAVAPRNFPAAPSVPRASTPPVAPVPVTPVRPPLPPSPPWGVLKDRVGPVPGTAPAGAAPSGGGLASLSEVQRKQIYRAAAMHQRTKELTERQIAERRARGANIDSLQNVIANADASQKRALQRLAQLYRLSDDDIQKIMDEGRDKNW